MGNKISEKSIVSSCLRWAKKIPNSKFRKRRGGVSNPGEPDIYGCIMGLHVEIEIKAPGGQPTELQKRRLVEWREAGCMIRGVAYSLDEFKVIITEGLAISAWQLDHICEKINQYLEQNE